MVGQVVAELAPRGMGAVGVTDRPEPPAAPGEEPDGKRRYRVAVNIIAVFIFTETKCVKFAVFGIHRTNKRFDNTERTARKRFVTGAFNLGKLLCRPKISNVVLQGLIGIFQLKNAFRFFLKIRRELFVFEYALFEEKQGGDRHSFAMSGLVRACHTAEGGALMVIVRFTILLKVIV